MGKGVLIIQRFYYNFREGFFDYLDDINFDFKLINATVSRGRVKVHDEAKSKHFIRKIIYFFLKDDYVIFPFLFFSLVKINPRIIVTEGGQNTINNFQVILYCKLFRRNYIIWDLGKGYADFGNTFMRKVYMRLYKYTLRQSLYIYGYNSESRAYFDSLSIDNNKLIILYNTIDTRKIKKLLSASPVEIPAELVQESEGDFIYFIFVGTLLRSKNIELISQLCKLLGKKYFLVIVGDGNPEYKAELETIFEDVNHKFVGYKRLEQLAPYYKLASFSILPGLGGLSINQSMAFGVPVICRSADGAEKDLIISDVTGYIYSDIDDAYNYIISKTQEDWIRMGQSSKTFLYDKHSVEVMMGKFIQYTEPENGK